MPKLGTIIGRGISFPPRLGPDGRLRLSEGAENVREAIEVILMTNSGERLMLPEFGSGLPEFLFAPNIDATHSLLVERTREALEIWEPRINIDRVEATADPKDPQTAILTIAYRLVATNQPDEITLAVPTTA